MAVLLVIVVTWFVVSIPVALILGALLRQLSSENTVEGVLVVSTSTSRSSGVLPPY
jgi:hypothetical protein